MSSIVDPAVSTMTTVLHVQTDTALSGGIAGYVSTLVRSPALQQFRFAVTVPGIAENPDLAATLYGKALAVPSLPTYGVRSFIRYVRDLEAIVAGHRVDLIHAHAVRAAVACAWVSWRTGVPLVYTNHGLRYSQKTGAVARFVFRLMEAFACGRARYVVSIRHHDARRLAQSGLVQGSKLRTITTRVERLSPGRSAARGERPILLAVGSLIEVKRPDRFLDWVEALQSRGLDFEARWIGDGPLRAQLEADARRRRLPIQWCGHLSRQAVAEHLSGATLLLLTSQFEVFPLAVLEAYACGVPVISGGFDGVEEFLQPGRTGLLVDPDKPQHVAQAVESLLADPATLEAMAREAERRFADEYAEPQRMASAYASLYQDSLKR